MAESKKYEFRELRSTDLFLVINLVKKIGIDNIANQIDTVAFAELFKKGKKTDKQYESIGHAVFNIAQLIISKTADCQKEIYDLLEATSNLSREELESLDVPTFVEMIVEFTKKDEFKELFTRVASLSKKEK